MTLRLSAMQKTEAISPALPIAQGGDFLEYATLAENMRLHGTFSQTPGEPETFRTPGYPVFIAFISLLCRNWLFAVTLAQIGCVIGIVLLTFFIGRAVADASAGFIAAALVATSPTLLFFSLVLLSESLFILLLLATLSLLFFNRG